MGRQETRTNKNKQEAIKKKSEKTYQFVQLTPCFYEVVRYVQGCEVGQTGETVERGDLVVRDPQLFQCPGHVLQPLDLCSRQQRKGKLS